MNPHFDTTKAPSESQYIYAKWGLIPWAWDFHPWNKLFLNIGIVGIHRIVRGYRLLFTRIIA